MVRYILNEIIGGMRAPDRPSSPVDAYITEEEIFNRCNPRVRNKDLREVDKFQIILFWKYL